MRLRKLFLALGQVTFAVFQIFDFLELYNSWGSLSDLEPEIEISSLERSTWRWKFGNATDPIEIFPF